MEFLLSDYQQDQSESGLDYNSGNQSGLSSATLNTLNAFNLFIAIIGILGNLLICIIIIKDVKFYFILNLAIADLITCIIYVFNNFVLSQLENAHRASDTVGGQIYCKLIASPHHLFNLFSQISVFSLVSIAIERCFSLTTLNRAGGTRKLTKKQTGGLITLAWLLPTGFIASITIYLTVKDGTCTTVDITDPIAGVGFFLFIYLIPSLIMVILYGFVIYTMKKQTQEMGDNEQTAARLTMSAARKRITIILIIVTVAFIILWAPKSVAFFALFMPNVDIKYLKYTVSPIVLFIANINSIINPFVYFIGFKNFRRSFTQIFIAPISRFLGRTATDQPETTITKSTVTSSAV